MVSDYPSEREEDQEETEEEDQKNSNHIVILDERNIPFEEERPPNFSSNYAIKVHQVEKNKRLEEDED